MGFYIDDKELRALRGLRGIVSLLYYHGIRPYMDIETQLVGIKRKISWQSLREELYVEPQRGVATEGSPSKEQVRRAAKQLEKAGLIEMVSDKKEGILIFKCLLAAQPKSVKNKADIFPHGNQTQKPAHAKIDKNLINKNLTSHTDQKNDTKAELLKNEKPTYLKNKDQEKKHTIIEEDTQSAILNELDLFFSDRGIIFHGAARQLQGWNMFRVWLNEGASVNDIKIVVTNIDNRRQKEGLPKIFSSAYYHYAVLEFIQSKNNQRSHYARNQKSKCKKFSIDEFKSFGKYAIEKS